MALDLSQKTAIHRNNPLMIYFEVIGPKSREGCYIFYFEGCLMAHVSPLLL